MPTSLSQIGIIFLFITPGFVFARVLGLSLPQRSREATSLVLDSLTASCFNFALLSPVLWLLLREDFPYRHPVLFAMSGFLILFVFPVVLAILVVHGVESPRFARLRRILKLAHPVPRAWDYFFRQGRACGVVATLKDGKVVAGIYGPNSFASSYPDEDLYIEKLCAVSADGHIGDPLDSSVGAILRMDQVQYLEFYTMKDGNDA